jgi:hypothetical protein
MLVEERMLLMIYSTGRLQHQCGMLLLRHQRWKIASCLVFEQLSIDVSIAGLALVS